MSAEKIPVLTLDGPSGVGKGTVGQLVALTLKWNYLDSGALYRIFAVAAGRAGIGVDERDRHKALAEGLKVSCLPQSRGEAQILLDGVSVDSQIRNEECGLVASQFARISEVRSGLLTLQLGFRRPPGLVADGRDMGSRVFPDADLKVFLVASASIRAKRRYNQLKEKGLDVSLPALQRAIEERDQRDRERSVSPLRPADDAIVVDTSSLTIGEVVSQVLNLLER